MKPFLIILISLLTTLTGYGQTDTDRGLKESCRGCELLENLDHSLKVIEYSSYELIRYGFTGDCDSCFFGMVDSLKARFIRTSDTNYSSDGAYAEDFENADMFFKNFKPFCDYIYNSKDTGMVFQGMITELMYEMYSSPTKPDTSKIKKIRQFIKKQETRYRITGGERKFIDSFIDRAKQEGKLDDDSTQEEN
jgi:hypothetical protein